MGERKGLRTVLKRLDAMMEREREREGKVILETGSVVGFLAATVFAGSAPTLDWIFGI